MLTDKEKRELEKAAQEKLKIQQAYQDSKLSLMDEGLKKELAKISFSYTKKLTALKGSGKELEKHGMPSLKRCRKLLMTIQSNIIQIVKRKILQMLLK